MNKQEIQNKIENFERQLAELKEQVNSLEFEGIKKGGRQKPKKDENYFFLGGDGGIYPETYLGDGIDLFRFNTGNCFKSEQEAKDYRENLLTKQQLKALALELNNEVEIDWKDIEQEKYYIYFDHRTLSIQQTCVHLSRCLDVYCLDSQFLTIAKDRIGEEKLIKLIESGI